jgi:hypothetical protein
MNNELPDLQPMSDAFSRLAGISRRRLEAGILAPLFSL